MLLILSNINYVLENDLEQDSSDFVMKKKKTPFTIQFHSLVDTISLVKADGKIHVFWGVVIIGEATRMHKE